MIVEEDITATTELIQSFTANAQRSDFTPLEKAELIQMLMRENNWSPAEVARQLGISPAEVCKLLAISKDLHRPFEGDGRRPDSFCQHRIPLSPFACRSTSGARRTTPPG